MVDINDISVVNDARQKAARLKGDHTYKKDLTPSAGTSLIWTNVCWKKTGKPVQCDQMLELKVAKVCPRAAQIVATSIST